MKWFLATSLALALVGTSAFGAGQGDIERGAKLFKKCKSCHMVGPTARNRVGPHLNELFGRQAGSIEGYDYSEDLEREGMGGLHWTTEKLHIYIENPKALISQTFMNFRGLKDAQDRTDLLAFLRQYSANPQDIPESEPTALPNDPDVDAAILAIAGDREYGEYLASECTTCHQADGADEGIPSITGWPTEDFVIAMHAYKVKARPHPVMQMMSGRLSDEEIASLAVYFEALD
ncbi:MAG: c-type cytochrome [Paracoccaceae bacterium]